MSISLLLSFAMNLLWFLALKYHDGCRIPHSSYTKAFWTVFLLTFDCAGRSKPSLKFLPVGMLERGLKSSNFGKGRAGSLTASCVGSVYLNTVSAYYKCEG